VGEGGALAAGGPPPESPRSGDAGAESWQLQKKM
jgi:hypothetical protein